MTAASRARMFIMLGLLPALLIYTVFVIIPVIWSSYYGLFSWKGMGAMKFIGLQNYREVVSDPIFWSSFRNNLYIVAYSVFGQVPIALLLALLLVRNRWFEKFIRASVFMPMVLSSVVIGLVWGYIYHPQIGILNYLLDSLGLSSWKLGWLSDPKIAMLSIGPPIIWSNIGPYLILFIAALQNIPSEVNDAAKLDGAVGWEKLSRITLPMIWGMIKVAVILCISGSLKAFDLIFVMTHGGPAHSTELLATYMYNNTFNIFRYGYGSAVSTSIVILSLILILISQLLMNRKKDAL